MARPPSRDFGKRTPATVQTFVPVKRSRHVALLVMGTVAVGGGAYALTSGQNCQPKSPAMAASASPGMAAPASPQPGITECSSRGSSSGGHGGYWSHHSFYGGNSASSSSSSSTASGSSSVTRGGFGSFAHSFASHFSGGG